MEGKPYQFPVTFVGKQGMDIENPDDSWAVFCQVPFSSSQVHCDMSKGALHIYLHQYRDEKMYSMVLTDIARRQIPLLHNDIYQSIQVDQHPEVKNDLFFINTVSDLLTQMKSGKQAKVAFDYPKDNPNGKVVMANAIIDLTGFNEAFAFMQEMYAQVKQATAAADTARP